MFLQDDLPKCVTLLALEFAGYLLLIKRLKSQDENINIGEGIIMLLQCCNHISLNLESSIVLSKPGSCEVASDTGRFCCETGRTSLSVCCHGPIPLCLSPVAKD